MAQRKSKTPHNGGIQLPLIVPHSDWKAPSELPDLRGAGRVALDRETRDVGLADGWGPGWARGSAGGYVCGTSVAWREGDVVKSAYFPVRHEDTACFDPEQVRQWEIDHQRAGVRFAMQNAPYDVGWGAAEGVPVPPLVDDAVAMANMIDEQRPEFSLNSLCSWRGVPGKDETMLREALSSYGWPTTGDSWKKNLWRLPARYVGPYAEADAAATLMLCESMDPEIDEQGTRAAYQLEMDLLPMVHAMRLRGVRVDLDAAEQALVTFRAKREQALRDLSDHLGVTVGIGDLRRNEWLDSMFTHHRLTFPREGGRGSFEAKWMRRVDHWLPRLVCDAKAADDAAEKFVKTYVMGFAWRGRLHATVNQFRGEDGGTRTFRFSYSDPPLQQMPHRDEILSSLIRGVFLPELDEWWLSADYCHDEKTDILTEKGWVKFPDLGDEKVAQWSQSTGRIDFATPTAKYVGSLKKRRMVRVRSKRVDMLVTENHRVLLQHRETREQIVVAARSLSSDMMKIWEIPQQTSIAAGPDVSVSDDFLRLVVACQADAADRWKYRRTENSGSTWVFYLQKSEKIQRLRKILRSLKIQFREKTGRVRTSVRIDDFPDLRAWLGEDKTFCIEKMQLLSFRQKRLMIEELKEWDGSSKNKGTLIVYGSENKKNIDVMSAIGVQAGYIVKSSLAQWTKPERKPFHFVTFRSETYSHRVRGGTIVDVITVMSHVYCVTMPSSFIVTRRNGRLAIGGQSQQEYRLIVHFADLYKLTKASVAAQKYRDDPRTDFHRMVAGMTDLERKPAKDCNFAKSYGAGKEKFAAMIGKSVGEAARIMDQYDSEMPFVSELFRKCQIAAERQGHILLLDRARVHFGTWEAAWLSDDERRRGWGSGGRIKMGDCSLEEAVARTQDPEHPWYRKKLRRAKCRKAMNAKIQGSAARQTKMAMRECWRAGYTPLIQMHDELGFSFASQRDGERVAEIMRDVVSLNVPMMVDAEWGRSWGDATHSWDEIAGAE